MEYGERGGRGGRGRGRGRGGFRGGFNNNAGGPSNNPKQIDGFSDEDRVAVKIRGMPYNVHFQEVSQFFNGYGYIDRSVVLGVNGEGRKNGFGAILFDNEDKANTAVDELNEQYIGDRWVELSVITYGDYSKFNGPVGKRGGNTVRLADFAREDNIDRALLMRGCPWKVTPAEVQGFFDGYGKVAEDEIHIEEFNDKRTGSVLVFFESEQVAQEAKEGKQKQTIGEDERYVELFDKSEEFFIKVCKL